MQSVIFDMDGVVIDSEPLWKIADVEAFAKLGLDLTYTPTVKKPWVYE